jgi:hypothetical protein
MSESSKKHVAVIQAFSLFRRGIKLPSDGLTCTITGDTEEEVRAKLEKLYATTKEWYDVEVVDNVDDLDKK